jgi:CubicO group peptidase (beta-lactamase class C family)
MPDRIRSAAARVIERHHLPGISIGVVRGDDVVFCEGFGYADIESKQPMDPALRQCIASITKTMVGLCLMALVDEGKLHLDDRITDLLPDVKFDGPVASMTLWHLLTHTGGIGEAPTPAELLNVINPNAEMKKKPGGFGEMFADGVVTEFKPGTKWHYANTGYNLLGEIIQRAEHADLADVMQRRIFDPLGMRDSDLLGKDHPALSTPYHRPPNEDTRFQLERAGIAIPDEPLVDGHNVRGAFRGEFSRAALAAGGVQSTMPDMARYASALLRKSSGIVKPATFDEMTRPQYAPEPSLESWGLSFNRTPRYGRTFVGHGGAYFGGWNSQLSVLPDENIAVIQHINIMMDEPAGVFRAIWRAVLDEREPAYAPSSVHADVLASAPGVYALTPGRLTNFRPATRVGRVTVMRDGDGLRLQSRWGSWKHGVSLTPCDDGDPCRFAIQLDGSDPAYVTLTRGQDGRVDGLRCDSLVRMVRIGEAE